MPRPVPSTRPSICPSPALHRGLHHPGGWNRWVSGSWTYRCLKQRKRVRQHSRRQLSCWRDPRPDHSSDTGAGQSPAVWHRFDRHRADRTQKNPRLSGTIETSLRCQPLAEALLYLTPATELTRECPATNPTNLPSSTVTKAARSPVEPVVASVRRADTT
jgi:hypothetical protein